MRRFTWFAIVSVVGLVVAGCSGSEPVTVFGFEDGSEGWVAGFADHPVDGDLSSFELSSSWGPLPNGLDGNALFIEGHNRSDDLFMYWKTQIEGLEPNTTYQTGFTVELASNTPGGLIGIGGSPGESVWIKAGASSEEPVAVVDDLGWLRMTVDIGNQAEEGSDAVVLGTIANPNLDPATADGSTFALMTLSVADSGLTATADGEGRLWVFVGSDSGFEGLTTLYYSRIEIDLAVAPSG